MRGGEDPTNVCYGCKRLISNMPKTGKENARKRLCLPSPRMGLDRKSELVSLISRVRKPRAIQAVRQWTRTITVGKDLNPRVRRVLPRGRWTKTFVGDLGPTRIAIRCVRGR